MYNKGTIIPGLIIFVLFVTFPIWFNGFKAGTPPKPELPPGGEKKCVESVEYMRANHMQLLDEWRDNVLRDGNRSVVTVEGKDYRKGLQMACMQCHSNKEKFCDSCHTYAAVNPYCWDCHLSPKEAASKEETR
ncbi:MAG: sulfate reduction electron transfer complex DsrMKJOP subunit DsrJ [Desulfoarculaceae bacterium]|nr:sulfate reduction electron transfer complex DsrMKJOP subunit DsrJ [Desulfoarculaceae bacterium]